MTRRIRMAVSLAAVVLLAVAALVDLLVHRRELGVLGVKRDVQIDLLVPGPTVQTRLRVRHQGPDGLEVRESILQSGQRHVFTIREDRGERRPWLIEAEAAGCAPRLLQLDRMPRLLIVKLNEGATILIRPNETPLSSGDVRLVSDSFVFRKELGADSRGRLAAKNLPPGKYRVSAVTSEGTTLAGEVDLEVGAQEFVHLSDRWRSAGSCAARDRRE